MAAGHERGEAPKHLFCVGKQWQAHAPRVPCREASRKASLLVDTTIVDERREPLKLPAFEAAVMHAATRALERWRDEALEGAAACARVTSGHAVMLPSGLWARV